VVGADEVADGVFLEAQRARPLLDAVAKRVIATPRSS
jgi:hypothetical protein